MANNISYYSPGITVYCSNDTIVYLYFGYNINNNNFYMCYYEKTYNLEDKPEIPNANLLEQSEINKFIYRNIVDINRLISGDILITYYNTKKLRNDILIFQTTESGLIFIQGIIWGLRLAEKSKESFILQNNEKFDKLSVLFR
jgi:hypothetical protein